MRPLLTVPSPLTSANVQWPKHDSPRTSQSWTSRISLLTAAGLCFHNSSRLFLSFPISSLNAEARAATKLSVARCREVVRDEAGGEDEDLLIA